MDLAKRWFHRSKLVLAMLLVQAFATGMQLLSRVILVQGTFVFALMTYRHLVAALCVAPLAFYFERSTIREEKHFKWKKIVLWLFANALAGITSAMGLFYYGLRETSATYATNFLNLIPIVTFVLSIFFKLEKLELRTKSGIVKIMGALVCVSGALTTSLYKGKAFFISHHHIHSHINSKAFDANWALGTLMLVGSCFSYSAWFLIQLKFKEIFPYKYWVTMMTCIIGAVQSAVLGLCIDRSVAAWRLDWNLQLITIIYSGSLATAATFCLLTWAISMEGPTYPPMFNPLTLIFVAVLEALILGVAIRTGSLIGTVLIIFGIYSFLWGHRKESRRLAKNKLEGEVAAGSQLTAIVVPSTSPPITPKQ